MRRFLLHLVVAAPLAGCVLPIDPIRLAAYGPATSASLDQPGRELREGDRIALVIRKTSLEPARLHHCIADGMRPRLPSPGPTIVTLDEAGTARLLAGLPAEPSPQPDPALPEDLAALGVEWAVVVRDASTRISKPQGGLFGEGGGSGGIFGGYVGEGVDYGLALHAVILDLGARRRLGVAEATYAARGSGGVAAGVIGGGGFALPFIMPVISLPAGTTAMTICTTFGQVIGDALVRRTTPPAESAPAAPAEGGPATANPPPGT